MLIVDASLAVVLIGADDLVDLEVGIRHAEGFGSGHVLGDERSARLCNQGVDLITILLVLAIDHCLLFSGVLGADGVRVFELGSHGVVR